MKKYYRVNFQYSESTYCTNIAIAESLTNVIDHYDKYKWASVRPASEYDIQEAKRKHMPIIEI